MTQHSYTIEFVFERRLSLTTANRRHLTGKAQKFAILAILAKNKGMDFVFFIL